MDNSADSEYDDGISEANIFYSNRITGWVAFVVYLPGSRHDSHTIQHEQPSRILRQKDAHEEAVLFVRRVSAPQLTPASVERL